MNPPFHQERRLARAKALHKVNASHPTTLYVDAAEYPDRAACVAVMVNFLGDVVASCSVSTPHHEVDEFAIALGLAATPCTAIVSKSQTGRVSPATSRIPQTAPNLAAHCPRLIWTPAHSSLPVTSWLTR
ncbi:hypothetical protein HPB48_015452 [Haemaphysalis longicornis]|uniref:Uncharacterized protein n=1 Tax=Haemaphysalis longicornis TaxID=44386 RepID=A0A9J6GIS4_HAELO|nr:hypothetical protein HPB48_015452 [Haemaphysalis longicornis]